jgi:hypothetical protein
VIVVAVAGTISALKWYRPAVPPTNLATLPFVLYNATTQAELARVVPGTLTAGWNTVAITPVHVAAGTRVLPSVYAERYSFTSAGHTTDRVVGNLTGPAGANDPVGNGRFRTGADGYPNVGSPGQNNYWTDIVFDADPVFIPVSSTLTARWSVLQSVESFLTAKWYTLLGPVDPSQVNAYMLEAQRRMTAALIADDPTDVELIPRVRVSTPTGGWTYQAQTPRSLQTVKMSLLNYDQRPTTTVAGVERVIDYHLIGPWNMSIAVGDLWDASDGTTWEVLGFSEGWGYMTKAFIGRHVPREARP